MVGTSTDDTPHISSTSASVPINQIFIGALPPIPASASGRARRLAPPHALTNRWVIHLAQDEKRSIRVTPCPAGPGAAPISVLFQDCDDGVPSDLVKTYALAVRPGVELRVLQEIIVRGNFKQYQFHTSGHGCRYWVWCLLGFLKENGIIVSSFELNGARIRLQQVWNEGGQLAEENQQTHLVPGHFFDTD